MPWGSHATFLSDTFLCICTGSAFTMNLKWSQQTVRGSWLGLKSRLTYHWWQSSSPEELIPALAPTVVGNTKSVQSPSITRKLLSGSQLFSKVEETIHLRLCFIHFCESLGVVRWALQTSGLDCLIDGMILQLDAETADGWLDKKQPMPSRANTSRVLRKWRLLCQNLSGENFCPWLEFGNPMRAWDPSALEILLTSSTYKRIHLTFSSGSIFGYWQLSRWAWVLLVQGHWQLFCVVCNLFIAFDKEL